MWASNNQSIVIPVHGNIALHCKHHNLAKPQLVFFLQGFDVA
jgi:hypothetical protein